MHEYKFLIDSRVNVSVKVIKDVILAKHLAEVTSQFSMGVKP